MASYLVTGGSSGLGLELVKILVECFEEKDVFQVIATVGKESESLRDLKRKHESRLFVLQMCATDENSVKEAVKKVKGITNNGLDILINNAGVMSQTTTDVTQMTDLVSTFCANVNSVHLVTTAFLPLLKNGKSKKVLNISSAMGSIGLAQKYIGYPKPAYKISKAALNMLTRQYALDPGLHQEGFTFLAVNPGVCRLV
ncbi:hypothetical protein VTN31DRAFT_3093 [Thermomyces dupontii]|uniref:uncharacterized protein n=1 Tax=Talaromyces thermophilus TaxID=28565 RepID=UPI003744AB45